MEIEIRAPINMNDVGLEVRDDLPKSPNASNNARELFLQLAWKIADVEIRIARFFQILIK